MCSRNESVSIVRSTHPATTLIAAACVILLICVASMAGPRDIYNPVAEAQHKAKQSLNTNTNYLDAEAIKKSWDSAKNDSERMKVIGKLIGAAAEKEKTDKAASAATMSAKKENHK